MARHLVFFLWCENKTSTWLLVAIIWDANLLARLPGSNRRLIALFGSQATLLLRDLIWGYPKPPEWELGPQGPPPSLTEGALILVPKVWAKSLRASWRRASLSPLACDLLYHITHILAPNHLFAVNKLILNTSSSLTHPVGKLLWSATHMTSS